jgi:hypothetical protein
MRIIFFENIYAEYSRLEFSYSTDRSVGITGIETRLGSVYGVQAKFGILHDPLNQNYLCRSLLWQNADPMAKLAPIPYPDDELVPSWSWMAVMGHISYMDIPFDTIDWNSDIKSPLETCNSQHKGRPDRPLKAWSLIARAYKQQAEDGVVLDNQDRQTDPMQLKCVVFGTEQTEPPSDLEKHYCLLIAPCESGSNYNRVGVASFVRRNTWSVGATEEVFVT